MIPPHIRGDLAAHLADNVGPRPDALLFPAARGGRMNDRVFSREYFADALAAIGRQSIRVRDLRHFAGTQAARVGNLTELRQGRLAAARLVATLRLPGEDGRTELRRIGFRGEYLAGNGQ